MGLGVRPKAKEDAITDLAAKVIGISATVATALDSHAPDHSPRRFSLGSAAFGYNLFLFEPIERATLERSAL